MCTAFMPVILLPTSVFSQYAGSLQTGSFERPEGSRWFYLYVPSSLLSDRAHGSVPLTLYFHGFGGNASNGLGFIDMAERYSSVLLSGQGTPNKADPSVGALGWNAGTCCLFQNVSLPDDVLYTTTAIELSARMLNSSFNLTLDRTRLFGIGRSNGGMMTERLGCEVPIIFRALVSVIGILALKPGGNAGLTQCDADFASAVIGRPPHSLSMLHVHGTADDDVYWNGTDGAWPYFPSVPADMAAWSRRLACTNPRQTFSNGPYSNSVSDCEGSSQLELVTAEGGGHKWFNDSHFSTTDYTFAFLARVSAPQPSTGDDGSDHSTAITIAVIVIVVLLLLALGAGAGYYNHMQRNQQEGRDSVERESQSSSSASAGIKISTLPLLGDQ